MFGVALLLVQSAIFAIKNHVAIGLLPGAAFYRPLAELRAETSTWVLERANREIAWNCHNLWAQEPRFAEV